MLQELLRYGLDDDQRDAPEAEHNDDRPGWVQAREHEAALQEEKLGIGRAGGAAVVAGVGGATGMMMAPTGGTASTSAPTMGAGELQRGHHLAPPGGVELPQPWPPPSQLPPTRTSSPQLSFVSPASLIEGRATSPLTHAYGKASRLHNDAFNQTPLPVSMPAGEAAAPGGAASGYAHASPSVSTSNSSSSGGGLGASPGLPVEDARHPDHTVHHHDWSNRFQFLPLEAPAASSSVLAAVSAASGAGSTTTSTAAPTSLKLPGQITARSDDIKGVSAITTASDDMGGDADITTAAASTKCTPADRHRRACAFGQSAMVQTPRGAGRGRPPPFAPAGNQSKSQQQQQMMVPGSYPDGVGYISHYGTANGAGAGSSAGGAGGSGWSIGSPGPVELEEGGAEYVPSPHPEFNAGGADASPPPKFAVGASALAALGAGTSGSALPEAAASDSDISGGSKAPPPFLLGPSGAVTAAVAGMSVLAGGIGLRTASFSRKLQQQVMKQQRMEAVAGPAGAGAAGTDAVGIAAAPLESHTPATPSIYSTRAAETAGRQYGTALATGSMQGVAEVQHQQLQHAGEAGSGNGNAMPGLHPQPPPSSSRITHAAASSLTAGPIAAPAGQLLDQTQLYPSVGLGHAPASPESMRRKVLQRLGEPFLQSQPTTSVATPPHHQLAALHGAGRGRGAGHGPGTGTGSEGARVQRPGQHPPVPWPMASTNAAAAQSQHQQQSLGPSTSAVGHHAAADFGAAPHQALAADAGNAPAPAVAAYSPATAAAEPDAKQPLAALSKRTRMFGQRLKEKISSSRLLIAVTGGTGTGSGGSGEPAEPVPPGAALVGHDVTVVNDAAGAGIPAAASASTITTSGRRLPTAVASEVRSSPRLGAIPDAAITGAPVSGVYFPSSRSLLTAQQQQQQQRDQRAGSDDRDAGDVHADSALGRVAAPPGRWRGANSGAGLEALSIQQTPRGRQAGMLQQMQDARARADRQREWVDTGVAAPGMAVLPGAAAERGEGGYFWREGVIGDHAAGALIGGPDVQEQLPTAAPGESLATVEKTLHGHSAFPSQRFGDDDGVDASGPLKDGEGMGSSAVEGSLVAAGGAFASMLQQQEGEGSVEEVPADVATAESCLSALHLRSRSHPDAALAAGSSGIAGGAGGATLPVALSDAEARRARSFSSLQHAQQATGGPRSEAIGTEFDRRYDDRISQGDTATPRSGAGAPTAAAAVNAPAAPTPPSSFDQKQRAAAGCLACGCLPLLRSRRHSTRAPTMSGRPIRTPRPTAAANTSATVPRPADALDAGTSAAGGAVHPVAPAVVAAGEPMSAATAQEPLLRPAPLPHEAAMDSSGISQPVVPTAPAAGPSSDPAAADASSGGWFGRARRKQAHKPPKVIPSAAAMRERYLHAGTPTAAPEDELGPHADGARLPPAGAIGGAAAKELDEALGVTAIAAATTTAVAAPVTTEHRISEAEPVLGSLRLSSNSRDFAGDTSAATAAASAAAVTAAGIAGTDESAISSPGLGIASFQPVADPHAGVKSINYGGGFTRYAPPPQAESSSEGGVLPAAASSSLARDTAPAGAIAAGAAWPAVGSLLHHQSAGEPAGSTSLDRDNYDAGGGGAFAGGEDNSEEIEVAEEVEGDPEGYDGLVRIGGGDSFIVRRSMRDLLTPRKPSPGSAAHSGSAGATGAGGAGASTATSRPTTSAAERAALVAAMAVPAAAAPVPAEGSTAAPGRNPAYSGKEGRKKRLEDDPDRLALFGDRVQRRSGAGGGGASAAAASTAAGETTASQSAAGAAAGQLKPSSSASGRKKPLATTAAFGSGGGDSAVEAKVRELQDRNAEIMRGFGKKCGGSSSRARTGVKGPDGELIVPKRSVPSDIVAVKARQNRRSGQIPGSVPADSGEGTGTLSQFTSAAVSQPSTSGAAGAGSGVPLSTSMSVRSLRKRWAAFSSPSVPASPASAASKSAAGGSGAGVGEH